MNTINARIKSLREALNITKADLARKVGVNRVSVGFWENGTNVPKSEVILKLALILKTTPEYILFGEKISNTIPKKINFKGRIPIMLLSNVKDYLNNKLSPIDYTDIPEGEEKNKFCIIVEGDYMESKSYPSFPEGSHLIIDKKRKEKLGDFVIAKIIDTEIFIFRRLAYDINKLVLLTLNPIYQPIEVNNKIEIIGVMVQQRNLF